MSLPQLGYLIRQGLEKLDGVENPKQFIEAVSRICGLTQEANFAVSMLLRPDRRILEDMRNLLSASVDRISTVAMGLTLDSDQRSELDRLRGNIQGRARDILDATRRAENALTR